MERWAEERQRAVAADHAGVHGAAAVLSRGLCVLAAEVRGKVACRI